MDLNEKKHVNIPASRAALKTALFAAVIFICAVLETSFFSKVRLFSATPDIMLALVMGLAVFDGERTGAALGIWAGVVADAHGGAGLMFSPLFYMLAGYLAGIAVKTLLGKNFPSWLVLCFAGYFCRALLSLISAALTADAASLSFSVAMRHIVLPEFASSFPLAMLFYFLTRLLCRPFHKSMEMT